MKYLQYLHYKPSLRLNLKSGKYKIVVCFSKSTYTKLHDGKKVFEYLNKGGSKFLLRLAASKCCTVKKSRSEENKKIELTIINWFKKALNSQRSNLLNVLLLR